MNAYDLIAAIRPRLEFAPPTVNRALRQLISAGTTHRIESLNAFVVCRYGHGFELANRQGEGVGFVICERCGAADEFVDPSIGKKVTTALSPHGFSASAMTLEVRSVCTNCSDKAVAR